MKLFFVVFADVKYFTLQKHFFFVAEKRIFPRIFHGNNNNNNKNSEKYLNFIILKIQIVLVGKKRGNEIQSFSVPSCQDEQGVVDISIFFFFLMMNLSVKCT